jgi:hypothetical protein
MLSSMSVDLFRLDTAAKRLQRIPALPMSDLGLNEPYDLETWLASRPERLFARKILWVARQDRLSVEQRSDLVGIDGEGNLLIAELKRGILDEGAVTQALGYAAEYSDKSADELQQLYAAQREKAGETGLILRAESFDDARKKLATHIGPDIEINDTQILILLGEQFSAKALAICDYLNEVLQSETCSIECWRYSVLRDTSGHYFSIEQVLPPPNVRQQIEEKRGELKSKKYARDPVRVAFMTQLMASFSTCERFVASRNRGQSYDCRIRYEE